MRTVSLLRSLLRDEISYCVAAIDAGDAEMARRQLGELRTALLRAINVLNRLR